MQTMNLLQKKKQWLRHQYIFILLTVSRAKNKLNVLCTGGSDLSKKGVMGMTVNCI